VNVDSQLHHSIETGEKRLINLIFLSQIENSYVGHEAMIRSGSSG